MKRLKGYILEFWAMRENDPAYTAHIVCYYLEHRGPPMPQIDWTVEQWTTYRDTMERMYEEAYRSPDIRRETELHPFNEFRNYPLAMDMGDGYE